MTTVLLCDDSAAYRAALREILSSDDDLKVVGEAATGGEAVEQARVLKPDVVLMDVGLPGLNGIDATRIITSELPHVRVLGLTAHGEASVVIPMIEAGARGCCLKGGDFDDLKRAILASKHGAYLDERALGGTLQEVGLLYRRELDGRSRLAEVSSSLAEAASAERELTRGVVEALAAAVATRDGYTGDHGTRVATSAQLFASRVAPQLAADPMTEYGFLLHDIGKLGIPDDVLLKPGALTLAERQIMETHVRIGVELLSRIPRFGPVCEIVAHHHERWEGGGYPHGVRGEAIPIAARVFAICDAYDAMTSDRPYRNAMSRAEARDEIEAGAGTQFDPALVDEFSQLLMYIDLAQLGTAKASHA
jgi:response regulator RpfG family c-di-GMP phosphodiesterase